MQIGQSNVTDCIYFLLPHQTISMQNVSNSINLTCCMSVCVESNNDTNEKQALTKWKVFWVSNFSLLLSVQECCAVSVLGLCLSDCAGSFSAPGFYRGAPVLGGGRRLWPQRGEAWLTAGWWCSPLGGADADGTVPSDPGGGDQGKSRPLLEGVYFRCFIRRSPDIISHI